MSERQAATMVQRGNGAAFWRCPICARTLGEVVNGRVIVKMNGRILSLPATSDVDQVCPRCGCVSVLP